MFHTSLVTIVLLNMMTSTTLKDHLSCALNVPCICNARQRKQLFLFFCIAENVKIKHFHILVVHICTKLLNEFGDFCYIGYYDLCYSFSKDSECFSIMASRKYEEICAPRLEEFCFITDNTYTKGEV